VILIELAHDDRGVGERAIKIRRVEPGQPIPQRDVRRRGLLGLKCDDPVHRVDHADLLAAKKHLAAKRGAVEPSGSDLHAGKSTGWGSAPAKVRLEPRSQGPKCGPFLRWLPDFPSVSPRARRDP
jgi:hypothetical protein